MPEESGAVAPTGGTVTQNLEAAFARLETAANDAPIDNSTTEEPEAAEEVVEESEAQADPDAPEEDAEDADEKADEPDEKAEEDADDKKEPEDVDELDYLTAEELKDKFPRNSSKDLINLAARYSQEAKEGQEAIESLGGKFFVKPLAELAAVVRDENVPAEQYLPVFTALADAGGEQAMGKTMAMAAQLVFSHSKIWTEKPETADFGHAVEAVRDRILDQEFGLTYDELLEMKEFVKDGWFDKLKEWSDLGVIPEEDVEELQESISNPKVRKVLQENRELKRQKEAEKASAVGARSVQDTQIEESFGEFTKNVVSTSLNTVAWAKSPLRDISTDTDEMKSQKAFFRSLIEKEAIDAIHGDKAKAELLKGFREGKQGTAVYQTKLANTLAESILPKIQPTTRMAEDILAKLYGKTRNAKLITPANGNGAKAEAKKAEEALKPTIPTNFKPSSTEPRSIQDVDKMLEESFRTGTP